MFLIKNIWVSILIPLVTGTIQYKKLSKSLRFIYWYIFFGFLSELTNRFFIYTLGLKNTMFVAHIYISVAFLFAGLFYLHELKGFFKSRLIIGIIVAYELFCLHNILFFQSFRDFPSIPGAISSLLLIAFSVLLFTKIMKEGRIKILTKSPVVWINTAVLFFFTGNFFYYTLYNFILSYSVDFSIRTINFFAVLYAIFHLIVAIGFWKAGKEKENLKK